MTDLTSMSIYLGRWSGIAFRFHYFFVFVILGSLLTAAGSTGTPILATACWLSLLVAAVLIHEAAHILVAMMRNVEIEDRQIWPLGNFVVPAPGRPQGDLVVESAGLVANLAMVALASAILAIFHVYMTFNPIGHGTGSSVIVSFGAPINWDTDQTLSTFQPLWWLGWFGYFNWLVFLGNMIPALPMDAGRIIRVILARSSVGLTRENPYAIWTARATAGIAVLVGFVWMIKGSFMVGCYTIALAFVIEVVVRIELSQMEEGEYFEEGLFGYDFSEGYTSLESSSARVRPTREGTIRRWRRLRSESRKQRQAERTAAEEQRLDEILDKLHRMGKAALNDEEQRFLVRIAGHLRKRAQSRA